MNNDEEDYSNIMKWLKCEQLFYNNNSLFFQYVVSVQLLKISYIRLPAQTGLIPQLL